MSLLERPPIAAEQEKEAALAIAFTPEIRQLNAEYPYWDKAKYLPAPNDISPRELWFALKLLRQLNRNRLVFGKYRFSFTVTDEMFELLHYFDMHTGEQLIPSENKNAYLISSIMEEAIASSQMEGASTTRRVAKDMLRKSEKPKNKGQQMILNNYLTINYIKEHSEDNFSLARLKEIHRLMTVDTLDDENDAGELRDNDTIMVVDGVTGGVAHTPPHYAELEGLLAGLEKFFNQNGGFFIHPVVKAIIVHFMLSYFHPFADGNGRTARSLFYWYMIKQGYWLVEYMSISRIIYKTKTMYEKSFLYTEYDDNDLTYFILYNLRTMKKAFEELKLYLKRKTEESNGVLLLATVRGITPRQAQIIKIVQENPNACLLVKEIENRFSVGNQTARTDLYALVKLGYLSEIQMNKRKTAFIRSKEFDAKMSGLS
jgi:Fic family protein